MRIYIFFGKKKLDIDNVLKTGNKTSAAQVPQISYSNKKSGKHVHDT